MISFKLFLLYKSRKIAKQFSYISYHTRKLPSFGRIDGLNFYCSPDRDRDRQRNYFLSENKKVKKDII